MESRVENSTLSPTTSENALNFSSTEPGPGAGSDVDDDTGWTVNVPAELEGDTTKGLLIGLGLLVLFVVIVIFVIRKLVEMCRTWNEADKAWLPDGYSQIFRSYDFGPSGFWTMASLRFAAKFDPFLSLDCARVGSNFAA